jgi:hypothetical protein
MRAVFEEWLLVRPEIANLWNYAIIIRGFDGFLASEKHIG